MKKDAPARSGGFTYRVTEEQIRRWQALPPAARLQWLEDANCLLWLALPPRTKDIRERFRRGDL